MKTKRSEQNVAPASASGSALAPALAPILLIALAAGESLLSLFQWMELLVLRAGGSTVCGVNDVVDCQRVWDSGFASAVHRYTGIPVAGFGLVWGLVALGVSLAWTYKLLKKQESASLAAAVKLVALVGVLSVPMLAIATFTAGAICLTCLATYTVVAAFALVALRVVPGPVLPRETAQLKGATVWSLAFAVIAYLVLLGPGIATPRSDSGSGVLPPAPAKAEKSTPSAGTTQPASAKAGLSQRPLNDGDRAVVQFIETLPPPEKQRLSNWMTIYREKQVPAGTAPEARRLYGPKDAPMKMVEWVDIRCSHCKYLNETMNELKRVAPEGSFSVEARNFPLDSECNPHVQMSDGLGVRCLAAKAMICLEPTKEYWDVRDAIFAEQTSLTKSRILELASSGSMKRPELEACVASAETATKLQEDINYAMKYDLQGTPLVVVNGREGFPGPSFLYSLALTGADARSPAFNALPAPAFVADEHAGHNH